MQEKTTDLCDRLGAGARVLAPIFVDLGGRETFSGKAVTVKSLTKQRLARLSHAFQGSLHVLPSAELRHIKRASYSMMPKGLPATVVFEST